MPKCVHVVASFTRNEGKYRSFRTALTEAKKLALSIGRSYLFMECDGKPVGRGFVCDAGRSRSNGRVSCVRRRRR